MPISRLRSTGSSSRSRARGRSRRRALAALTALAATALLRPAAAQARERAARVLAWGERGLWVGHDGDEAATALGDEAPAAQPPRAHAQGVVAVDAGGRLRAWHREAGRWREQPPLAFDAPVHALGASDDGQWTLAAHGQALSLVDARGRVQRRWSGHDLAQRTQGTASAIRHLPQRRSFVIAWPTLGELWELQLDPAAPPVFDGLVHDHRMGEGLAAPGFLGLRRTLLGEPMPSLGFSDARVAWVAGRAAEQVVVVHLDVRRRIAAFAHADARVHGAALVCDGAALQWWLPVGDAVHAIDPQRWQPIARQQLPAPVRALHSAPGLVWAWIERDEAPLMVWRGGRWEPVDAVAEALQALALDPHHATLLCAVPEAIRALDTAGRAVQTWRVDANAALRGVAAFPT
jgi:hypothetical protein